MPRTYGAALADRPTLSIAGVRPSVETARRGFCRIPVECGEAWRTILSQQTGKISVSLSSDLVGFVREQTKSGKYASASEVVQEALRLLEAVERIRADRLRDVRTKITEGLASLNRGDGLDGEGVFRELDAAIPRTRGKKSRR